MKATIFKYIIIKSFGNNTLNIRYNQGNRIITHVNMCITDTDEDISSFVTLYSPTTGEITVKVEDIIELVPYKA